MKILQILKKLKEDGDTVAFWEEVDTEVYTDYLDFVSKPMDLLTVSRRVHSDYYGTNDDDMLSDFKSDVQLVLDNCRKYSPTGTPIHIAATRVDKKLKQMMM